MTTTKERKLGEAQKGCLEAINRYGAWPGGWVWGTASATDRVLASLAKRGLVHCDRPRDPHFGHVGHYSSLKTHADQLMVAAAFRAKAAGQ